MNPFPPYSQVTKFGRSYISRKDGRHWGSHCEKPNSTVISHADTSTVVCTNCRHLRTELSLNRVEMPDEQDLDLEPVS